MQEMSGMPLPFSELKAAKEQDDAMPAGRNAQSSPCDMAYKSRVVSSCQFLKALEVMRRPSPQARQPPTRRARGTSWQVSGQCPRPDAQVDASVRIVFTL